MKRPGWYIVAYDIANPKRLAKVHRILKKEGLAVQKSVFFVQGDETMLNTVLDKLQAVIKNNEDDIRAYPVTHPGEVWTTGGPIAQFPLIHRGDPNKTPDSTQQKKTSWWKKLIGR